MIRWANAADASAVTAIYNRFVRETTASFDEEELASDVMLGKIGRSSDAHPFFVYEESGTLLGFCYAHEWKEKAAYRTTLETTIYLLPEASGRGIGRQMMTKLIATCRAAGIHALVACITDENEHSCEFHSRLGFTRVSHFREVGRKFGRWLGVCDYILLLDGDDGHNRDK